MEIQKAAVAGTLESSDAQVTVEPRTGGIHLELSSSVMNQYAARSRPRCWRLWSGWASPTPRSPW